MQGADGKGEKRVVAPDFAAFRAKHLKDDIVLTLNAIASTGMIVSVLYVYWYKIEWTEARPIFMVSVALCV